MRRLVVCDIGGTHARFAIATTEAGRAPVLGDASVLRTAEFAGLLDAWLEFTRRQNEPLPRDGAIAFAGPVEGTELALTNSDWKVRPDDLAAELGLDRLTIVNDFGAVAHAVPWLADQHLVHVCGPAGRLPQSGLITLVGPGTGLGVAAILRSEDGANEVVESEGGHMAFAPLDDVEDRLLAQLRARFGRVSVERLVSGPGLANIYQALGAVDQRDASVSDPAALWSAAIDGSDSLARTALDRFCRILGAVAGDLALAQGARAVVIAGGIGLRLADKLGQSGFGERFLAKGRFANRMAAMPVKALTHPQPGLLGAAAAFAREHC